MPVVYHIIFHKTAEMSTGTVPKILFLTAVSLLILGISLIFVYFRTLKNTLVSPVADSVIKIERTLDRYAFNNLSLANFTGNEMEIGEEIRPSGNFTSRLLFFNSEGKKRRPRPLPFRKNCFSGWNTLNFDDNFLLYY